MKQYYEWTQDMEGNGYWKPVDDVVVVKYENRVVCVVCDKTNTESFFHLVHPSYIKAEWGDE